MSVELYVFDFDGTLVNTGDDIALCVNAALKNYGYWELERRQIISFVGDGARNIILRSLKASTRNKFDETTEYNSKKLEEVLAFYKKYYEEHPVNKSYLYAGIKELLRVLKAKNKKTAILTNKPGSQVKAILKHFELEDFFDVIVTPEVKNDDGSEIKMKPEGDGLFFITKKINEKFGTNYNASNVIMIGDGAQDIKAGKAYGCKTVACRGGMGDRQKLAEENADLSFSVASEIEKFIDVLSKDDDKALEIQKMAMEKEVPIIQDEGSDFICNYIKEHNCKSIFEIGTAIGFSTVRFAKLKDDIHVTTIEIDKERFEAARENIKKSGCQERITSIFGDALVTEIPGQFDLIFIDAAKAQYTKFFERFKSQLSDNGVFISDNLSFHGMVEDLSLTRNYSTIKLVKKIRKYIDFLKTNEEFKTTFYKVGDGIAVSRRK